MLLTELKRKSAERSAVQATERNQMWTEFVRSLATAKSSESPSPEQVLEDLDQMGRSVDELQEALEKFATREKLAEQVSKGDQAKQALADTQAEIDQAEAELNAARLKFEATIVPLRERNQTARNAVATADYARRELIETAGPECRNAILEPFETAAAEIHKKREAARKELVGLSEWISVVQSRGERASTHDKEELLRAISRIEWLNQEEATLRLEGEALNVRRAEASKQLLDPAAIV